MRKSRFVVGGFVSFALLFSNVAQAMTVGSYIDSLKNRLNPESMRFLKAKIKGAEKTPLQIRKLLPNQYVFEIERSLIPLRFEKPTHFDPVRVYVNNKPILYDARKPIEVFWNDAEKTFPRKTSFLLSLFVPEARAVGPVAMAVILGVAASVSVVAGTFVAAIFESYCDGARSFHTICKSSSTPEQTWAAAQYDLDFPVRSTCRDELAELKQCLVARVDKQKFEPPAHLREYFGFKPNGKDDGRYNPLRPATR